MAEGLYFQLSSHYRIKLLKINIYKTMKLVSGTESKVIFIKYVIKSILNTFIKLIRKTSILTRKLETNEQKKMVCNFTKTYLNKRICRQNF